MLELTMKQLREKLKKKEISVSELVEAQLRQIEQYDGLYHAYNALNPEVRRRAEAVQAAIDQGLDTPVAGIPIAVKDNIATRDMPTTASSKILEGFLSPYDATVMQKLEAAGAVILGKTNMDEFAMGSTTETSYTGISRNPWDTRKAPGGSSGGSAVAVAADEAVAALGSDTGGSIRQPCAYCGITGMKPTYGRVSRYGLLAYGSSLDQIGPCAKSAEDCAGILEVISGYDEKDSTSLREPVPDFRQVMQQDLQGKIIGLPMNYLGDGLNPQIKEAILAAARQFETLGARVEEFTMPMIEYAVPAYYIIASAEASSNLSRYDGIKYGYHPEQFEDLEDLYLTARSEGFGLEVKRRIMLGTFALSSGYYDAYYQKALKVKALIMDAFDQAFSRYDAILSPVAPNTAPKLGESLTDPLQMYLTDIYTVSVNLAGLPGLALPCGFDENGMPIGMQLLGQARAEAILIQMGCAYQRATDFHTQKPLLKEAE